MFKVTEAITGALNELALFVDIFNDASDYSMFKILIDKTESYIYKSNSELLDRVGRR